MYDLIIHNALVIDGTGSDGFVSDLAIQDGRIARLAPHIPGDCPRIDATGLVLCPGFIDSHSHGDMTLLQNPDHREPVEQGITFAVGGHCGSSVAPSPLADRCVSMEHLRTRLQDVPLSIGYGILTGHGSLRAMVAGLENRPVTEEELTGMCRLLEQSMEQGSMGLSLGLTYPPGSYADTRELIALAEVVGKKGGILTAHIRNESDDVIASARELITVCEQAGCRGVLSHLKSADEENFGKVKQVLGLLEQAHARGVEVYADAYPYSASSTSLRSRFIPRQFHPPGTTDVMALLEDPKICESIKAWATGKWGTDLSWVLVTYCKGHPQYRGMNMNQIAQAMGIEDRYDAVFALLRRSGGSCQCCFAMMSPEDVSTAISHPLVMIGCDSTPGNGVSVYHPRRRGTFPRVLGKYVREEQVTSLPEMIRKMTGLPAQVYGLTGKGRIAEGYDGDLCIFDPRSIRDTADYVNCTSPNEGLRYVIIGGKVVLENNVYNGTRAGKLFTPNQP